MLISLNCLFPEDGYFLIKFECLEDNRNDILYVRPYTLNNNPLIVKAWTPKQV